MIPAEQWKWRGHAGHHCCGRWMRFHLCTEIGNYLISTVGQYVHPRHAKGDEQPEAEWLADHPHGEEIGLGRTYETYVFKLGHDRCTCGCNEREVSEWCEIDSSGYSDNAAATLGHMHMCRKYATKQRRLTHDRHKKRAHRRGRRRGDSSRD